MVCNPEPPVASSLPSSASFRVHKLGGTSLAVPERYERAAELLEREGGRRAVVVSAMAGVTDALIDLCRLAESQSPLYEARLEGLLSRHRDAIRALTEGDEQEALLSALKDDARDLGDVLRGAWLMRRAAEGIVDFVAGHGELWSARVMAALLRRRGTPARMVDARQLLVVEKGALGPEVQWAESRARVAALLAEPELPEVLVITGFICSTKEGVATTLERNGSDFTASIFANLLGAADITIWTDVDGVLSADPRRVPEAVVTSALSYREAMELAYFGAKVLHPSTMGPAVERGIPIRIKNASEPDAPGTLIGPPVEHATPDDEDQGRGLERGVVKGFATIDDIALVNVEGTGMIGVPGVAERVFGALRAAGVNVVLIAQASSEHSICLAVSEAQGPLAQRTLSEAFEGEIRRRQIESVELRPGCTVLAAVGDRMADTPGVAGKLMGALGRAGVNIRAVAQGSSERNISIVVDKAEVTRGLRAAHAGFYLSEQTLSVGLVGPGLIGSALLEQLRRQCEELRRQFAIDVRVRAIASSKRMVLADPALDLASWREALEERGQPLDLDAFTEHVQAPHLPHALILDCTAADLGERYEAWLQRGIHVLTPNKKPGAGPLARYRKLRESGRARRGHYFYEATVGAGLPVIKTLRDLVQTGDRVLAVEGVLSGTLSYLFNRFTPNTPFSSLVLEAKERGFTEPDPRDDLSGMDVARKVVILAREMCLSLELDEVSVESLVPAGLRGLSSANEFLARLPEADEAMRERVLRAEGEGAVLRYVGIASVQEGARVELRAYPKGHPFARLSGSDNIIAFTTERYREQPLIVQGPGAGPEVTAAGVFADLLRLAAHLGAPS